MLDPHERHSPSHTHHSPALSHRELTVPSGHGDRHHGSNGSLRRSVLEHGSHNSLRRSAYDNEGYEKLGLKHSRSAENFAVLHHHSSSGSCHKDPLRPHHDNTIGHGIIITVPPKLDSPHNTDYRQAPRQGIPDKGVPQKTVCCILFLCLVAIGLTIAVILLATKAVVEAPPCTEVTSSATMKFQDITYNAAYNDKTSTEYAQLTEWFCTDLSNGLEKIENFNECGYFEDVCTVNSFSPDRSTNIFFKVKRNVLKSKEDTEKDKEELSEFMKTTLETVAYEGQEGPDMGNIFKKGVTNVNVDVTTVIGELPKCPVLYTTNVYVTTHRHGGHYAGESVTFRCHPGFRVHGDETDQRMTCRSNGKWDTELFECEALVCPPLTNLENHIILKGSASNNTYGDQITTRCQEGFSLDLSDPNDIVSVVECKEDGTWDQNLGVCQDINECDSTPCQNGGTCTDQTNRYNCSCDAGFTDTDCQTDINECASTPCQNDGTCFDQTNSYICSCYAGFTELHCETDIDECASTPCQNDGICTDQTNGYSCNCNAGYSDDNCETDIDECASTPCLNGGTCDDDTNGYSCTCVTGFIGTHCETDVDDCLNAPCENGGTCSDGVNEYTCACIAGSSGTNCDVDTADDCVGITCAVGKVCEDRFFGHECVGDVVSY